MSPEEQQINTDTISVEPTVIEGSSVTMLFEETKTETDWDDSRGKKQYSFCASAFGSASCHPGGYRKTKTSGLHLHRG